MAQDYQTPPGASMSPKQSNRVWIIVIIVVVLLLCCCGVIAGLYFFGDAILQYLNNLSSFIGNWLI